MEIRYAHHPEDFKTYTTEKMRQEFLIPAVMVPGSIKLVYSHVDRIIAGGAVRAVMEAVGITNIRTKCLRSNNPQNVVKATMQGLQSLRDAAQVARIRGKNVDEIVG